MSGAGAGGGAPPHQIRLDFAHSTQTVIYGMAGAMALAFIVALRAMPGGKAEQPVGEAGSSASSSTVTIA